MKFINMIKAGIKFSKSEIGEIAQNGAYTTTAVLLIAFSVLLDTVISYFKGNGGSSGVAGLGLTGINAAIAEVGSLLIGTFLSALIMTFVIRIFKVKPSYNGILRVYGSAIIWTILGSLVGLLLPPNLAMIVIVFWLAYNFAVLFGLTGYTKIKLWQSFLSIVITFAIVFIIMMPYGMLIEAIFK